MTSAYIAIPGTNQWKSDSGVTFAIRCRDEALVRIDRFLADYHETAAQGGTHCGFVLCDLFLAINAWIKRYHVIGSAAGSRAPSPLGAAKTPARVLPGYAHVAESAVADADKRYPAVLKLLEIVARRLSNIRLPENEDVVGKFEDYDAAKVEAPARATNSFAGIDYVRVTQMVMYLASIPMKLHGYDVDSAQNMQPFSANKVVDYRVWFKRGKAYQIEWWSKHPTLSLKLADSSKSYDPKDKGAFGTTEGYGPFVMTMDLEMYMTQHSKARGIFHSCYVNQKPVLMAGTMLIENGKIRAIRCDSGHYQPNSFEFKKFLIQLRALEVKLATLKVFDKTGNFLGTGEDVLVGRKLVVTPIKDNNPEGL